MTTDNWHWRPLDTESAARAADPILNPVKRRGGVSWSSAVIGRRVRPARETAMTYVIINSIVR